jgi:hypothetical protein
MAALAAMRQQVPAGNWFAAGADPPTDVSFACGGRSARKRPAPQNSRFHTEPLAADRAGHRGEAERIRRGEDVRGAGASRNCRGLVRCDRYASHAAQVDDDAVAQGATGPIVASAAHRQRKTSVAGGPDGRPHVFDHLAVDDRARHAPDRF